MKLKLISILLIFSAAYTMGQSTSDFEQKLYNAYVADRILDWKSIMGEMKASYLEDGKADMLHALCFAQYGYIGYCIGNDLEKKAKECLKDAKRDSKELAELYNKRHDVLALQGALYGYQIILSKFSAMYLGPKAFKLISKASESSDKYFNCSLEHGNLQFFTPKFLGGSKEEAIKYYKNAVDIISRSSKHKEDSWLYINTVLLLANAYYDTGSKELACKYYDQILHYEPNANWIRKEKKKKCGK